ncbi:MAG: hypothetical protein PHY73_08520 [Candidatus Omnitrophica bacterium]|nr:hypothetical protein [Candidatus Omnitrophota bacterium]
MDKLDKIFLITDAEQRQKELCDCARSFNISIGKVKNEKGELNENKLAVLIYEARENQIKRKKQTIMLITLGLVVLAAGLVSIYVISKVLAGLARS